MGLLNTMKREKDGVKEPTRSFSKRQEDAIAKKFGGERVKNSGATMFQKGDVKLNKWMIEAKTHTSSKDSMAIKRLWLEKNRQESLFMGKPYSALAFNFGPNEPNYYVIDEDLFAQLVEFLDQENQ